MKTLTDENGTVYEEVSYSEYLKATNKIKILKTLEAQYFIEKEKA